MSRVRHKTSGSTPRAGIPNAWLVWALLAVAILALKIHLLFRPGMEDMVSYQKWGTWVGEHGLAEVYFGVYFPIQYQIFGWTWSIARALGVEFFIACKALTLLFDIGSFALVILLLRRYRRSLWLALLYWAHPWFVTVFSLGYVDFQFAFFLLLALYLATAMKEAGHWLRYHLLVGTAIAIGFLMKPQAQVIVIALFAYAVVQAVSRRTLRYFVTLAPAVALYVAYSIYFALAGAPLSTLTRTYLDVGKVMPCLTAHMLNVWYPLAYALKNPGDPIYAVSDAVLLTPLQIPARTIAMAVSLTLVLCFAGWQAVRKEAEVDYGRDLGAILAFVTMVVPFTMTSAHENHLFLGSIFLLLYIARTQERSIMLVWQAIFMVQFINIFALYETGNLAAFIKAHYPESLRTILAIVDSLLFLYLLYAMAANRRRASSSAARAFHSEPGRA